MPALGHRAPGPIAALLEDERVTVELINDGTHLHPAALELAFRHAGADRVAFITDAMDAAGIGDGRYMLGPLEVEVSEGVARLVEGGSIAGSTLTQDRAFKRAVTVDRLPVEDVVAALSTNRPASSASPTRSAPSPPARTPTWSSWTRTSTSRA